MLQQGRYASDVACYPEKREQIFKEYNDMNKNSMAIRFFLEYISAQPAHGQKIVGQEQYEYILAICFMIIEWAYKNDLFLLQYD